MDIPTAAAAKFILAGVIACLVIIYFVTTEYNLLGKAKAGAQIGAKAATKTRRGRYLVAGSAAWSLCFAAYYVVVDPCYGVCSDADTNRLILSFIVPPIFVGVLWALWRWATRPV